MLSMIPSDTIPSVYSFKVYIQATNLLIWPFL